MTTLERRCRRHYIHNPKVAAFLIRLGRVQSDLDQMREFYADLGSRQN